MEIKEHCEIRNRETGRHTFVGNVCINRFIDLGNAPIFAGLRKIRSDIGANANMALIAYAESKGFLFQKEVGFLVDTSRKRNLSVKQRAWKEKINRRIVEGILVRTLPQERRQEPWRAGGSAGHGPCATAYSATLTPTAAMASSQVDASSGCQTPSDQISCTSPGRGGSRALP